MRVISLYPVLSLSSSFFHPVDIQTTNSLIVIASFQPWIWDASSGDVCSRLARHRSPVLDVASLQDGSSGKGLFAAVSQGEINVYHTHVMRGDR